MRKITKAQKVLRSFFIWLISLFSLTFFIQYFITNSKDAVLVNNQILIAYLLNFFLAGIIFLSLYFLRKKSKNNLGFLFLFGSLLKFAVFFVVFTPSFQPNLTIGRSAILVFFIPYLIGLITETWGLIKLLNLPQSTQ